jgi:hypothetical protein
LCRALPPPLLPPLLNDEGRMQNDEQKNRKSRFACAKFIVHNVSSAFLQARGCALS